MEKIRILELRSTYHYGGGPDKTILLSARFHDRERFEVIPLYLKGRRDERFAVQERSETKGVEIIEVGERFKVDPFALLRIATIVRKRRFHIIHSHDYKTDTVSYLISLFFPGLKLIATAHGWSEGTRRLQFYNRLDLMVLKRFDRVIAVSNSICHLLEEKGIPSQKIVVLKNAIDSEFWRRDDGGEEFKRRYFRDTHSPYPIIGTVGRLSAEKGLETFVRSCLLLLRSFPDARFVIAGDGPAKGDVENLIRKTPCPERFLLTGFLDDPRPCYSAIDIFWITSTSEGLPNALLEAMAMEKPIVSTGVGGIVEVIEDGESGLLVPTSSPEEFVKKTELLLKERELAERLGKKARERVVRDFSFWKRLKAIEKIYIDLAGI